MQPIKISIEGDFVDCQIYRGRLYLWTFEGKLQVIEWDKLVHYFIKKTKDNNTLKFAFLQGNFLYKASSLDLFRDKDYRKVLESKFNKCSTKTLTIDQKELNRFLFGEIDFNSIPTDTEIYSNTLYHINDYGLFKNKVHQPTRTRPITKTHKKIWDCNLLSIKASKYPQMALSGGSEGLYELDISDGQLGYFNEPELVSKNHSSFANYTFWSIYNSSLVNESSMELFSFEKIPPQPREFSLPLSIYDLTPSNYPQTNKSRLERRGYKREFLKTISDSSIFEINNNSNRLSWGIDDRIYSADQNGFRIVRFDNYAKEEEGDNPFHDLIRINLHAWKGEVIGGGTSYFGTIVECENALVVILSNGETFTIPGSATRWRVYPRSLNYENHLHVIQEDRIEIYSFNQDYFVDQKEKNFGFEYKEPKNRWSQRT